MAHHVNRKILIAFLCLIFIIAINTKVEALSRVVFSGTYDEIYAVVNGGFVFWGDHAVDFTVTSGILNGSAGDIEVRLDSGTIGFTAEDTCTILISSVSERDFLVECSGAALSRSNGNYTVSITSGLGIRISWRYLPWSLIDNYFMLGIGLTGIILLIAGPTMFARTFIKHGLDTETIEWFGYSMLMMIFGFGFVVVWLWPG